MSQKPCPFTKFEFPLGHFLTDPRGGSGGGVAFVRFQYKPGAGGLMRTPIIHYVIMAVHCLTLNTVWNWDPSMNAALLLRCCIAIFGPCVLAFGVGWF